MEGSSSVGYIAFAPVPGSDLMGVLRDAGANLSRGWVEAVGEIDVVTLSIRSETSATERGLRSLSGSWDLVSLRGELRAGADASLYAIVARDTAAGPQLIAGRLVSARVVRVDVVLFGSNGASTSAVVAPLIEAGDVDLSVTPPAQVAPPQAAPSGWSGTSAAALGIPRRLDRPQLGPDVYPEEGDIVTHFAFGRCTVMLSDGERIRLQQERDGRVREVALSMLRIDAPTTLENGKRHFELARKN